MHSVTDEMTRNIVSINQMAEELSASGQSTESETERLVRANGHLSDIVGQFKLA